MIYLILGLRLIGFFWESWKYRNTFGSTQLRKPVLLHILTFHPQRKKRNIPFSVRNLTLTYQARLIPFSIDVVLEITKIIRELKDFL